MSYCLIIQRRGPEAEGGAGRGRKGEGRQCGQPLALFELHHGPKEAQSWSHLKKAPFFLSASEYFCRLWRQTGQRNGCSFKIVEHLEFGLATLTVYCKLLKYGRRRMTFWFLSTFGSCIKQNTP